MVPITPVTPVQVSFQYRRNQKKPLPPRPKEKGKGNKIDLVA